MPGGPDASGGFPSSFLSEPREDLSNGSALLERREQLLSDCMDLRFRMQSSRCELPQDIISEMITTKDRLVEADEAALIGRLSSRLSCYMQKISARLDAPEFAAPVHGALHGDGGHGCMHAGPCTKRRKRDRTGSATSGSESDVGERSLEGHDSIASIESKRRRFGETCSPTFEARIAQPSVKRAREGRDVADNVGGAEPKKSKPWKKATDVERQLFSYYVLQRMLTEEPPPPRQQRTFGCAKLTGYWKKEHFVVPYSRQKNDDEKTTTNYWTNSQLPGLQAFWEQAKKIRGQLAEYSTEYSEASESERQSRLQGLIRHATGLPNDVLLELPQLDVQVRFA